jgi:hypothetical protein
VNIALPANAITAAHIAPDAVSGASLALSAVATIHIASNQVTSAAISASKSPNASSRRADWRNDAHSQQSLVGEGRVP